MSTEPNEPRNLIRLWLCVVFGAAIWFCPVPEGLNEPAWHVFAVFAATILGFLMKPLPMGPCVLIGLIVLCLSGELYWASEAGVWDRQWQLSTMQGAKSFDFQPASQTEEFGAVSIKTSFAQALTGFADTTTWLVVAAFLIAGAVVRSGLGRRVALMLIKRLGGTSLGLGYAIAAAEFCLGPFIPSNTARGGGVMAPIVDSLSRATGSSPGEDERGAGRYLVLCGAHANLIAAAMFLTGMAANPLVSKAAADTMQVEFGWGRWLLGSIVPGVASMATLPLVLHWLAPPLATGGDARGEAVIELAKLGRWSPKQLTLAIVLVGMVTLWASVPLQKSTLGYSLPTALVALIGVTLLVLLGVERWRDICGNSAAWDTLVWLGGLVTMCNALNDTGFAKWFAESAGDWFSSLPAIPTALALTLVYFYSMYAFSMLTGHIMAFAAVFFAVAFAAGAPPLLMTALIAYFGCLCGCTTNYSSGPTIIYYGLGYVPIGQWYRVGFAMSVVHLILWLAVGLPYWKFLGWW